MSSYILVPYYNTIPKTSSNYFTFSNGTLIVSVNDILGNSSKFLTTSLNQIVYIFNGPNMGTFTASSVNSSTNKSYTLTITLNSIPPNLVDNTLCVLSLIPSAYSINRTFINTGPNINKNGNFTLNDSNTILINKLSSTNTDEALFLYIIATNKSFNITTYDSFYKITDVIINTNQINSAYISFSVNIPIIPLIESELYELNIVTENASTVSNTVINNTTILPILNSSIDLVSKQSQPAFTPAFTPSIVTQVNIPLPITNVSIAKNINNQINQINSRKKTLPYNNSVILTYQASGTFLKSGSFSLTAPLNPNLIDLYTNVPTIEHLTLSRDTIPVVQQSASSGEKPEDSIPTKAYNSMKNIYNNIFKRVKEASKKIIESQIKPEPLSNIPILLGMPYTLSVSTLDSFNNNVNFLKQNSLIYLSNGLKTTVIATTTIPIYRKAGINNIIECNVIVNSPLPITTNSSFLLSSAPILPYITYMYKSSHIMSNVIDSGYFAILSRSATNKFPTIIMSNFDILFNNNVTSFSKLLYTIIQDPVKQSSPPYLNILNSDYSLVCTLEILHVIPDIKQTTFTYSIVTGASNFAKLNNKSNYIFTLLSPSDFTSDNSIINRTLEAKPTLIENNNLIQGAYDAIYKLLLVNPNDSNTLLASNIMTDTLLQSQTLVNMPVPDYVVVVSNGLLTNTYNAVLHALLTSPKDNDLKLIFDKINNTMSPLITYAMLNNASKHIDDALSSSSNNVRIVMIKDNLTRIINDLSSTTDTLSNTPTVDSKSEMSSLLADINAVLKKDPLNQSLIKAKNILTAPTKKSDILENIENIQNYVTTKMKKPVIEKLENVNSDNNYNNIMFAFIVFVIVIAFLINNSKK